MEEKSDRLTASSWQLLRQALGGPRQIAEKTRRLGATTRLWFDRAEIDRRFAQLAARGYVEQRPQGWQLFFGGLDMLRFMISPAAADYYAQLGIDYGFHQVLRFLEDPGAVSDPTGLLSQRDSIIGHVMQVVHLNPVFDMQLLEMFPDGLDEMERQVAAMIDGSHPRATSIRAIVEDPHYHERLLDYVRRYRVDRSTEPIVRQEQTLRADPHFAAAERTFHTLPGFLAYCNRLPSGFGALALRFLRVRRFPLDAAPQGT